MRGRPGNAGELPREVLGQRIDPLRSPALPATDEAGKQLGLKRGIRLIAADLSGL